MGKIARSQLLEVSSMEERLNKWVSEAEPGENRLEAKNRILVSLFYNVIKYFSLIFVFL